MKLLFASIGDAAAFRRYAANQVNHEGRQELRGILSTFGKNIILTDLRGGGLNPINSRIDASDRFALVIAAKNLVGDNCLATIKDITESYHNLNCLLINCDIEDKVSTGMTERTKRDVYRAQFKQIYYFRNIVRIERPSLMPYELGALTYSIDSSEWKLYACNHNGGPDANPNPVLTLPLTLTLPLALTLPLPLTLTLTLSP